MVSAVPERMARKKLKEDFLHFPSDNHAWIEKPLSLFAE
jgi:hypothetical protein